MTVRSGLGRGSGQESPGFKALLRLPGEIVWPAFAELLERRELTLREIYEHPERHHEMFTLAEGLVDYDQLLQTWRYRHLMLVYRIIGTGTPSLTDGRAGLRVLEILEAASVSLANRGAAVALKGDVR